MNAWIWIAIAVVFILVLLVGIIASKMSSFDKSNYMEDEHGNIVLLDTSAMRAGSSSAYDSTIQMELRGHKLSNGESWNDAWLRTISSIRQHTHNPEWYIQYIIEQRRKAGLPELEGLELDKK